MSGDIEIVTSAYSAGEGVQQYRQNKLLGKLTPHHRIREVDAETVLLENLYNETTKTRRGVDTVVFAHPGDANDELYRSLDAAGHSVTRVGDCWAPRSLDEAVWEGFDAAVKL